MGYPSGILWLFSGNIIFTVDISDDIGGDLAFDSENRLLFLILILFLFHLSTEGMVNTNTFTIEYIKTLLGAVDLWKNVEAEMKYFAMLNKVSPNTVNDLCNLKQTQV